MKEIFPLNNINGTIEVSPDKSISHRAIIIGSIAKGITYINNCLLGKDCLSTINCLKSMGVNISLQKNCVKIIGKGLHSLTAPKSPLFVGNSGTTIRIICGLLVAQNFSSKITGDSSILNRPMKRIIIPLSKMGGKIYSESGYAPLKIIGKNLNSIEYTLTIPSAQVKSSILLASLYAKGTTVINEPIKCRNHTEIMLKEFGANIKTINNKIICTPVKTLKAKSITICGDISSASFFIVACLILKNSSLTIKNVGINHTRIGIIDILKNMGAKIKIENIRNVSGELVGNIKVKSSKLNSTVISGEIIPRLIDEIPILTVAATFASGTTIIKNANELKVKESNRIETISKELNKMGANIKTIKDGMIIKGVKELKGNIVNSYNDHRIAMSLSIAGILSTSKTYLMNSECVDISFPNFFKIIEKL